LSTAGNRIDLATLTERQRTLLTHLFDPYLALWDLVPHGEPIRTANSALLPVRRGASAAMLKLALAPEEVRGNALMAAWQGAGVAPVLGRAEGALLMARAEGTPSLAELVRRGGDEEATRILCRTGSRLHRIAVDPALGLVPLRAWFAPLEGYRFAGGPLESAAALADALLSGNAPAAPLHGDLHHGNVLHFGEAGWLAIDPKGLLGDPVFDFVNILRNPDPAIALDAERFERQVAVICGETGAPRDRLLEWAIAFCGLSAAWTIEEGEEPEMDLQMMRLLSGLR
jgi:streptomycin 6-kinase